MTHHLAAILSTWSTPAESRFGCQQLVELGESLALMVSRRGNGCKEGSDHEETHRQLVFL